MAPLLFKIDLSPPANAVRMLADIIGLELELKDVEFLKEEHKSPEYMKLNPEGVVPTLVDDGFSLGESHAIMIYMVSKYGGDKSELLYPSDLRTRAVVNQVLFFDASVLFVKNKNISKATIFDGLKAPTERHLADLEEAFDMLERFLTRNSYVAADHLTIADLSISCTLTFSLLIKELDTEKHPRIDAWYKKMQQEPSYKKIAVPGRLAAKQTLDYFRQKNNQ
ncbi:glutathione S-transferase 1-like [Trichoplusia ni]|uniref:Glutathione S-transferase 1-like n=1 Tax=Trichoplusia ni TaxID=7111 RepID=A0A7E5X5D8_TRINI|nr:glutathione S-transferase 1-like [Trichoplusia ni]XP_026747673.1 glutathione S-transferase 1-like [Trichoplusia ni]